MKRVGFMDITCLLSCVFNLENIVKKENNCTKDVHG